MEMQRFTFLKELQFADFKEEAFNLDGAEASAFDKPSTVSEATTAEDQWTINYTTVGTTNYDELVMDGPAPGGIKPIRGSDVAERCILAMSVPAPSSTRVMTVEISDPALGVSDKVTISQEAGVHVEKYDSFVSGGVEILFENDYLFTVEEGGKFSTYVNINHDAAFAKLVHSDIKTFDTFQFSLLALTSVGG